MKTLLLFCALFSAGAHATESKSDALVVPAFAKGKKVGYSIKNIQQDTVFAKVGLENGDVIKSVDGKATRSPEDFFKLEKSLKDGTCGKIQIVRQGKVKTLSCEGASSG
jgi:general secretion pathway protein C